MIDDHASVAGTPGGYQWHQRDGSPACDDCKEAHRRRIQRWRDRAAPEKAVATLPLLRLIALVDLIPESLAGDLDNLLGDELAERVRTVRTVHGSPARVGT